MFSVTFNIETESFNIYPTVILFDRMHWTNGLINNFLISYKMLEQNPQHFFFCTILAFQIKKLDN